MSTEPGTWQAFDGYLLNVHHFGELCGGGFSTGVLQLLTGGLSALGAPRKTPEDGGQAGPPATWNHSPGDEIWNQGRRECPIRLHFLAAVVVTGGHRREQAL